ncbi:TPMT family class I SAM-dependent methyltransferase [Antarcticibacterium sp. 1MA-6-2]|uniref:methyltransferase domain-containing protein n=1 Tax=Antarcticibacterium sp. 1MA-6-2 TaxID=2908210 RepID=UPI001F1CD602|nr:methyltransferase domain-containing protein [Antarcticibacterium sp. 1MA-6-2]UJH91158.1 TPMT family class I SAM-dependent methyltransferase [Antarcticibacterium sp. 1MA-6-2]
MTLNKKYWESRYFEKSTGWDLGRISPPLKEYIDQLSDKEIKILIPGAGNSYEAEYLFSRGFKNVYILDFARQPLLNIQNRIPSFPKEHLIEQDFFEHKGQYDLLLEQTFFCALPVEQRKQYSKKAYDLLKPEGKLAGVLFNINFPKPGPPFGGSKKEYEDCFKNNYEIKVLEPCYNSIEPRQGIELFFIFKKK